MENKKSFLAMNAGTTVDKGGNPGPYAFMVEGIVTNVGAYREASEGKPAILNLSVLVGRNPWALLGKDVEVEQASNANINAEHPFVKLGVFGQDAARLKDIQKNAKVVFCGRPVKKSYKKKEIDEDVVYVAVNTDCIFQAQTKVGDADDLHRWIPSMVNRYETQGEVRTQNMGMISCEVTNARDFRTTQSGKQVASATVRLAIPAQEANARINREYNRETDYGSRMEASIAVWGPRAAKMEKILAPGNRLVITASSKANTGNDGLTYVNLSVRDISVLKWASSTANNSDPADNSAPAHVPAEPGAEEYCMDIQGDDYALLDDGDELELPF